MLITMELSLKKKKIKIDPYSMVFKGAQKELVCRPFRFYYALLCDLHNSKADSIAQIVQVSTDLKSLHS